MEVWSLFNSVINTINIGGRGGSRSCFVLAFASFFIIRTVVYMSELYVPELSTLGRYIAVACAKGSET